MQSNPISRRKAVSTMTLGAASLQVTLAACTRQGRPGHESPSGSSFRYCLNTSTISGQKPGLLESIDIASEAGYDGIELWVRDIQAHLKEGHSAGSLKAFTEDRGIRIENAIGFAPWLAGGMTGFHQMEEEMHMLAEAGCHRIAAPPAGLPSDEPLDLFMAGEKYAGLLALGRETGVMPQLEFWGASPVLWHLGQALMITAVTGDPDARILADVYHLFRGGSPFGALDMIAGSLIEIFHVNDYPGNKPRQEQTDTDRVYPGDGTAPLGRVLGSLEKMGGEKVLSLELFNHEYWKRDPLEVARTGLQKMKSLVSALQVPD
jgi:2-keto-myo-inositol isomerase